MEEKLKKEFWKVFNIASFLFITVFFVLPYLVQISTYFHEKSHVRVLNKYNVENYYSFNFLETIPNFFNPGVNKLGITKFNLDQYKNLNKYQRAEINLAGIMSDLRFLFLIGLCLAIINLYTFYKIKFRKDYHLTWVLAVNWILFMWLLALIQITISNVSYNYGDIYQLIKYLKV
ncbi:hypothetical protein GF386_05905 [Candidatus Pacearchaeota archaeon]|nr:hypothetical protein [Candidatus Pacearchaeota archaeon]MBD3283627.1 hypothetical protein [Candidatus Pacearchaeota archaeon]